MLGALYCCEAFFPLKIGELDEKSVVRDHSSEILRASFLLISVMFGVAWQALQTYFSSLTQIVPGVTKELQSIFVTLFVLMIGRQFEGLISKNIYLEKIEKLEGSLKAFIPSDSRVVYKGRADDLIDYTQRRMLEAKLVKRRSW